MEHVENVFEYYCIRTPGSYIEKQSSSISWHYKEADPDFGDLQSKDLVSHLKTGVLANTATDIINIGRLVQVRPSGVSKGNSSSRIMSSLDFMDLAEFVLCVGGFLSRDEDIFTMLSQGGDSLLSGTPKMSSSMNGIIASSPARYPSSMSLISSSASVFTVSIGGRPSLAQYFIRSVNEVQTLLGKLVRSQRK